MSLDIRAVRFLASTSLGTQDITISGFGTPKAAMFYLSFSQAGSEVIPDALIGVGVTDGTNDWCFAATEEDAQGTSDTSRTQDSTNCVSVPTIGGGAAGLANFDSWITDGIRINWTDAVPVATYIVCVLYGGSDLENVTAGIGTANSTQNAAVTINTGHPNDLVYFSCVGQNVDSTTAANNIFNMGMAVNDGADTQRMMAMSSPTNQATTALDQSFRSDSVVGQLFNGSWSWYGEADNFTATSFDIITRNGSSGSDDFGYLAFDFSANVNKSLTTQDSPTATGDEATTGIGFQPECLLMFGSPCTAENTIQNTEVESFNISIINATEEFSIGFQSEDGVATTNTQSICDDVAINYDADDGSAFFDATLSSFDSDGWTLNYTAANGTIRKFAVLALGVSGGGTVFNVTCSDTMVTTDTINTQAIISAVLSDGMALTDSTPSKVSFNPTGADSAAFNDAVTALANISATLSELAIFTDLATPESAPIELICNDSITLSDVSTGKINFNVTCPDGIALTDFSQAVAIIAGSALDGIQLNDIAIETSFLPQGLVTITATSAKLNITFNIVSKLQITGGN